MVKKKRLLAMDSRRGILAGLKQRSRHFQPRTGRLAWEPIYAFRKGLSDGVLVDWYARALALNDGKKNRLVVVTLDPRPASQLFSSWDHPLKTFAGETDRAFPHFYCLERSFAAE